MQNIINDYVDLREGDKILFKEFLNDIISIDKQINDNKLKKVINQKELEEDKKDLSKKVGKYLEAEGITNNNLKDINFIDFMKETFGIIDIHNEKIIPFSVYKGDESIKNDNIFEKRIDILNVLKDNGIIRVSNFNIVKRINEIGNIKDDFLQKLYLDRKNKIIDKLGENVFNRQIEGLKGKERYLQLIIFIEDDIKKLIKLIKKTDIKEFDFNEGALKYGGKVIYVPSKNSARLDFLNYFFEKNIDNGITIEEIYIYIEGIYGSIKLNGKEKDKIYNLKRSLNKIIEQKTDIKDFFYFGNTEYKGLIFRKY